MNVQVNKLQKFKITKWIMLAFSLLLNGFIIFYSCLDSKTTSKLASPFTNFFVNLVNGFSKKEIKSIPLESIDISLSQDKYNNIPGYLLNEIPLGSAKEIECSFLPIDATNKSIVYSAEPSDGVILNQSGSKVSVVGMKPGITAIKAKSVDGDYESSYEVSIVETIPPVNFEISINESKISLGTTQTISFDIDGGVLGHNELINSRYFDIRKLGFESSNEDVAIVDEYGVIYPKNIGNTIVSVSNSSAKRSLEIEVVAGSSPIAYSDLSIVGDSVCYANEMILNQTSAKYKHLLSIKDGDSELNPEDFIWKSSNELLVKVDAHGVMRGFRKVSNVDENAIITATSKLTNQSVSFNVVVKNQLPTQIYASFAINGTTYWNKDSFTISKGDVIELNVGQAPSTPNKSVTATSSNENVLKVASEGDKVVISAIEEGKSEITIISVANTDLVYRCTFTIVKAGSIGTADIPDVATYVRKSVGHAAVFFAAQVFTFLMFYMFLYNKKWWFYSSISLAEGLFISSLSELIQYYVPTRSGALLDVVIDFAGVVVGFALAFIGILIVKKMKNRKKDKLLK